MLGRLARVLDWDDVIKLLRSTVEKAGGQSAFARQTGIDRAYLNAVLRGRMTPPPGGSRIVEALNLRIVYEPSERKNQQKT
jgi:DNA-binding phage protein